MAIKLKRVREHEEKDVEQDLAKDGINLFTNDDIMEEYSILPLDLTEVTSKALGRYFSTFTKNKMWARTLISRVGIVVKSLEEELDTLKVNAFKSLPVKMSVKEKELMLRDNERCSEILGELAFYKSKLDMLNSHLDNLVDGIFAISREISRREADWNDDKRESSLENKRKK